MLNESNVVIFINLNININANILGSLLKVCGKINKISVIAPKAANSHIGVVVFDSISMAYEAIEKFNDFTLQERKLSVQFVCKYINSLKL